MLTKAIKLYAKQQKLLNKIDLIIINNPVKNDRLERKVARLCAKRKKVMKNEYKAFLKLNESDIAKYFELINK